MNIASQSFRNSAYASDGITIILYENIEEARKSFDKLNSDLPKVDELGDASIIQESEDMLGNSMRIFFIRCHAFVYIDIYSGVGSRDDVYGVATTYAKRIDKRLQPLVCE